MPDMAPIIGDKKNDSQFLGATRREEVGSRSAWASSVNSPLGLANRVYLNREQGDLKQVTPATSAIKKFLKCG
jgi:hypothetical protein